MKTKDKFFPKLLDNNNPNVPPEDKHKIKELLKKPWNPYIQSALSASNTIAFDFLITQINPFHKESRSWYYWL